MAGPVPEPDLEAFDRLMVLLLDAPPVRPLPFASADQAGRANVTAAKERPARQHAKARRRRTFVKADREEGCFFIGDGCVSIRTGTDPLRSVNGRPRERP